MNVMIIVVKTIIYMMQITEDDGINVIVMIMMTKIMVMTVVTL